MYVLKENKERSISLVLFPQDILWGIIKNVPSKVLPFMSLSWRLAEEGYQRKIQIK